MVIREKNKTVIDLLYPSQEKRDQARAHRLAAENLPKDYAEDLQVQQLAAMICPVNQYNTVKLLCELNTDPEIINYRLDAIDDLINVPRLMPEIYKFLTSMLDNDRKNLKKFTNPTSFDGFRSRLDSFLNYIECVDGMHSFYEKYGGQIKSAAIKSLFSYFEEISGSDDYIRLKQLAQELSESLAHRIKSVTVAINFDEMMTPVSAGIVGYSDREYVEKPTVLDRILYFNAKKNPNQVEGSLFRKYMTDDPFEKDPAVNEADARLFKALSKITDGYVDKLSDVFRTYQKIGFDDISGIQEQLDLYDGMIRLIQTAQFKQIPMCRPVILNAQERRTELKNVYDMCLMKSALVSRPDAVGDELIVRNDISMDDDGRFYILTGANNGGKTTFIRAVGIVQLMAQAGLYVPAQYCEISPVDHIYTHFPREEETGINASRFTTEIKQFKRISDTITKNSLLLMNESIQSTTPKECVEIAAELVRIFTVIGARGAFATHLTELAFMCDGFNSDPQCRSKVQSIIVRVDEDTERRIYKVVKGLPGDHSYASTVFREFGIDLGEIRKRQEK